MEVLFRLENKERHQTFRGFQIVCERCEFLHLPKEDAQINERHCELPGRVSHTENSDKEFVELEVRLRPRGRGNIKVSYYVVKTVHEWYGPMRLTLDRDGSILNRREPPLHPSFDNESHSSDDDDGDHGSDDDDEDEHVHDDDEKEGHDREGDDDEEEEGHGHEVDNEEDDRVVVHNREDDDGEEEDRISSELNCKKSTETNFTCMAQLKDYFLLHWSVSDEASTSATNKSSKIEMLMVALTPGWGSIAFAAIKGKMHPADAILGWVEEDGQTHVQSYHIVNDDVTLQNANDSLFEIQSISRVDNWLHIQFTKSIDAGYVAVNLEDSSFLNYAIGKENRLMKHDRSGTVVLNFYTGSVQDVSPRKFYQAHGCLMIIAWIVLIPLSMMIARSKWSTPGMGLQGWLDLHKGLNLFAVIALVPALLIAVIEFQSVESRTGRVHRVLGILTSVFLLAQIFMGLLRPRVEDARRPMFNVAHAWGGRCLWLLSCIAVFVGISAFHLKVGSDPSTWVTVVLLLLLTQFLIALFFEFVVKKKVQHRAEIAEVGMVPIPYRHPGDADSDEHYNSD